MGDAPSSLHSEEWAEIPGHEGRYRVSTLGRFIGPRGTLIKPYRDRQGYLRVGLHLTSGKGQTAMAHRLVAAAFLGPCPEGCEVSHKDHDRANNRADNLEYLTHDANVKATAAAGRSMRGQTHVRAEIDEATAIAIIAAFAPTRHPGRVKGEGGMAGLARRHNTTLRVVRGILHGETWKHLPRDHNPHITALTQRPHRSPKKRSPTPLHRPHAGTPGGAVVSAKQEKGMTPETIKIGRRTYRKFIRPPGPVNDGTFRCFACGQIDEPPYHEDDFCPAMTSATNTGGGQEEQS